MESISREPTPDCLKSSYTPPKVWRPNAPIWWENSTCYKNEIQDDHLGEIKWRGIFNLLPSEEWSKLGERKVNLVGIRIRRSLVQVQVQVAITRNRVIIRMKMQVQLSSGLKLKKSLNNQQTPPPSPRCWGSAGRTCARRCRGGASQAGRCWSKPPDGFKWL